MKKLATTAFRGLLMLALLSSCQTKTVPVQPEAEQGGLIFAYLQPLPRGAERVRFSIERFALVRSDGREFPLPVSLPAVKLPEAGRQRLLASGPVPPGSYIGFSCTVKNAFALTEEGEVSLKAPDAPVRMDIPFSVGGRKAMVFTLAFLHAKSVANDTRFSPSFSVQIPANPLMGLTGYVTVSDIDTVMIFDKHARQITGAMATGRGPGMIALDQKLKRAYVPLSGDDAVDVIDATAAASITRIRLNSGDAPGECALTPDGTTLITANTGSHSVSIIDLGSLVELGRITVGQGPQSILIDRAGKRGYVFNTLSNTITVIDIPARARITDIAAEPGPLRGILSRAGDRLTVIYATSPYLTVIDPASLAPLRREFVGIGAKFIIVDPRSDLFYLAIRGEGVAVYDPFSLVPGDYLRTNGAVASLGIDGDENVLYLVIPDAKSVAVVDLVSRRTVSEMDFGGRPTWTAMMGGR